MGSTTPASPSANGERTTNASVYPISTLQGLFEAQVALTPDAPALHFRGQTVTYQGLNQLANRVAHELLARGTEPGCLVAVAMERSIEMVAALFGTLKARAAYVPVDPDYPPDRVEFMLEDSAPTALLTQPHLLPRLPESSAPPLLLGAGADGFPEQPATNPGLASSPEDLAYVIYTSGSTGRPKGGMIGQAAITNRIHWMQEEYGLQEADRVLQKTPFSFDVSVWEFFWPLIHGAQLEIAEPGGHRDATYLIDTITSRAVTTIHFVPSMLQLFLENPRANECGGLARVICSGEALPRALQDRFFELLPEVALHNLYGPTEAAVDVTSWKCDPDSELAFVPIGKPIANTYIRILDENLEAVPAGAAGELHIGGVQVGLGYLNRPELTAARFIPDPFAPELGARLYKTGDLARFLPDGDIEFLGRSDFQVKIRGFRVELGEIESALDAVLGVRQSVVISREKSDGDKELVAYISHAGGSAFDASSVRSALADRLPDYMVPSMIVAVDHFTLTPNGKIDRKALPEPVRRRPDTGTAFASPRNPIEKFVAEAWAELLGLDRVGRHDRFFDLGGTSLQAARFINRVQVELDEQIFVVTVFSAPSVSEYAKFLEAEYPGAVSRRFGIAVNGERVRSISAGPITEDDITRFRHVVPVLRDAPGPPEHPNPPVIFVLSPPRSGTTLLRIMLAGHPDIFSASELQLLGFTTLAERAEAYTGRFGAWLDGAIRTVMELKDCGPDEAKAFIGSLEDQGLETREFFNMIQEWVAPRLLADKSPSYALDPLALQKAETDFAGAKYIHLVRHPSPMVNSFEKHRMDQVLYLHDHPFPTRKVAELVWLESHRNIVNFLRGVPENRWHRLRFEDLVSDPVGQMKSLCDTLDLRFDDGLVNPYDNLDHKMVDGVYDESAPMGDPGFLDHGKVNAKVAEIPDAHGLGPPTLALAAQLGYESDVGGPTTAPVRGRSQLERQQALRRGVRNNE